MNLLDSFSILKDILTLKDKNNSVNKTRLNIRENNDIYESDTVNDTINELVEVSKERTNLSRDPRTTGIVNRNIRRRGTNKKVIEHFGSLKNPRLTHIPDDSSFSDDSADDDLSSHSSVSVTGDPTLLITRADNMIDNRKYEREIVNKSKINRKDSYLQQFEEQKFDNVGQPSSFNAVNNSTSSVNRMQTERNLALNGGFSNFGEGFGNNNDMSYGVTNDFSHVNMVPQFRGGSYGSQPNREAKAQDLYQRKMELFTGDESIRVKKTEIKPLFDPVTGATNIYGSPVTLDYQSSRYIPGSEKRNEKPFQEVRVTPGLNLGFNEHNDLGNDYRPAYKTIDELRTANKAQVSYTTPVVTSGLRGERGPVIGEQKKYRPERTKDWGYERHVKNYGYVVAPLIYGHVDPKNLATVNRGTEDSKYGRQLAGPAQNDISQAQSTNLRYKVKSLKQNFRQAEPRNKILVEGMSARENEDKYIPDPTQREQEYARSNGAVGNAEISKPFAFDYKDAIPDPTVRDMHNMYDRDGKAITPNSYKGHYYDPNEVPDPTIRNIHDRYDRDGKAITPNSYKGHYYDPNEVPDPTIRNIHDRYDRDGKAITPNSYKGHYYNPNEVPDVTKREISQDLNRSQGGVAFADNEKSYTINYDLITPDVTRREISQDLNRTGAGAKFADTEKSYTINYDLITPDVTRREISQDLNRTGAGAKFADTEKSYTINYDLITPDVTRREISQDLNRTSAGAKFADTEKSYTINYDLITPDVTRREISQDLNRTAGGAFGLKYAPRSRLDVMNAHDNPGRESIEMTGRTPTLSNYDKGPTFDFTMLRMCNKIQVNRAGLPSTIAINEKMPFTMTQSPALRSVENTRIDCHPALVLDQNPYINNLIHKSI